MFLSVCNHEGHFFFITGALGGIEIATAGASQNSRPYSHDIFMRRIFNRRNCLDIRRDSIFGSPGSIKRQRLVRRHRVQVLSCRPPKNNQKNYLIGPNPGLNRRPLTGSALHPKQEFYH
jgi:hypothetical protein